MKWFPVGDYLTLNIRDLNFSRKLRGRKSSLSMGSRIPENVTRRDRVGKVAKLFDRLGEVNPVITFDRLGEVNPVITFDRLGEVDPIITP